MFPERMHRVPGENPGSHQKASCLSPPQKRGAVTTPSRRLVVAEVNSACFHIKPLCTAHIFHLDADRIGNVCKRCIGVKVQRASAVNVDGDDMLCAYDFHVRIVHADFHWLKFHDVYPLCYRPTRYTYNRE